MKYAEAVGFYFESVSQLTDTPSQPSRSCSDCIDDRWYLANNYGPLATVDPDGAVEPPDHSDENWLAVVGEWS